MQGVSCYAMSWTGRVGFLLLWMFLGLNACLSAKAIGGHQEIMKNASATYTASHSSFVPQFSDKQGVLTNYLFTLITSTRKRYLYSVRQRFVEGRKQRTKSFKPEFRHAENRWDVVVPTPERPHVASYWSFRCSASNYEIGMAPQAKRSDIEKCLFFGWAKKLEPPIYMIVFVRGRRIYIRAYTNTGVGQDVELVADMGLATELPMDDRGRIFVAGAAGKKKYMNAVGREGRSKVVKKYLGVLRMKVSEDEMDEVLRAVFPANVNYTQLQLQHSFAPICCYSLKRSCSSKHV